MVALKRSGGYFFFFKSKFHFNRYKGKTWEEAGEGSLFPVIPTGHCCVLSHTDVLDAIKCVDLKCSRNMDTRLSWFPLRTVAIMYWLFWKWRIAVKTNSPLWCFNSVPGFCVCREWWAGVAGNQKAPGNGNRSISDLTLIIVIKNISWHW